jgi:long-chain fatty acid transport protein
MKRILWGVTLACVLAGTAQAQESNFRPYIVGSRAAGMGGAFTALADDGSGPYYNPAGIAFARRSSLSLSASVYGLATGDINDALGDGNPFHFSDLQTFPVSTSAIFKWGDRDTPDGPAANSLAFSAFVPDALVADDRDTLGSQQNAFFYNASHQTVWGGVTYARRVGRLGIGASGFVLIETATGGLDLTAIAAMMPNQFATITARTDETIVGAVGAFGLRWDATDHVRLGLSFYSPELGAITKRRTFVRITVSDPMMGPPQAVARNADDLTASPTLPVRVQGGVAWTAGAFTLAADAIFLGPVDVRDDQNRAAEGFDRHIIKNAVVNGSLGAEYVIAQQFPLRAGFFTDFSQAPIPQGHGVDQSNPDTDNTDHINRFGGTLSIGFRTEHTATDVGAQLSGGSGTDLVPVNLDFRATKPATSTQFLAYIFLASSYEF